MTEKLKQKFNEEIVKMPKQIQETVSAFDWGKISAEIGEKHFLSENAINDLQVEVMLILIGITSVYDLKTNIESNVETSKNEAEKIGNELSERIFIPMANKIISNTKDKIKNTEPTWSQNMNFILSGGDYTSFLTIETTNTPEKDTKITPETSKKEDLVVNFLKNSNFNAKIYPPKEKIETKEEPINFNI